MNLTHKFVLVQSFRQRHSFHRERIVIGPKGRHYLACSRTLNIRLDDTASPPDRL